MARKIPVKLILELHAAHMSRNQIAITRSISKNSVSTVLHIAAEKGIAYQDIRDMEEADIYRMFFQKNMPWRFSSVFRIMSMCTVSSKRRESRSSCSGRSIRKHAWQKVPHPWGTPSFATDTGSSPLPTGSRTIWSTGRAKS